ncbi:MAG: TIGR01777 family oxidoreductase [Myxococcales bacterium]|nr:TIGR01777 family oxidoreductase [Myxococcales bacterium]
MHVGMVGATGFLGRQMVRVLQSRGDRVTVFSRDPLRARNALAGVEDFRPLEGLSREACADLDALINLAGEPVMGERWSPAFKARIRESRVRATRATVQALAREGEAGPRVLLNASAVGYYGPRGDEAVDESAGPGDDFLARVCVDWEREARAAEGLGARVVRLRIGVVLGDGGALEKMALPFKLGLGGPMGSGRQYLPWVHVEDIARMTMFALDHPTLSGPLNLTAPEPARSAEFAAAMGRVLHRPAFMPTPAFVLKMAVGEGAEAVLTGQRAVPRALGEAGYQFRFTDLDEALRDVLRRA